MPSRVPGNVAAAVERIRRRLGPAACLEAPQDVAPFVVDFRGLYRGATPLVDCDNKPAVTALREIAAGIVEFREDVKETVTEYINERRKAGFM